MRVISVVFAGLMASQAAFAFINQVDSRTFVGGGQWKLENGRTGDHKTKLQTKKLDEHNYEVAFEASEASGTDKVSWVASFKGNGFFDVKMNEKVIGNGFCFENRCNYRFSYLNGKFEETLLLDGTTLTRLGSKTVNNAGPIAWQDTLSKK